MALLIKVDGSYNPITNLSLANMQKAVGGYVEFVKTPACANTVMLVDEDAPMKGKAINHTASKIAYTQIVGDVIVCQRSDID